jgi:hypothetical protein
MKWMDENKWFLLAIIVVGLAVASFRYDLVVNERAGFVLDRLTGSVRLTLGDYHK